MINFPEGLTKQQFLADYWQQMPLLFNKAMAQSEHFISKQQLFDLSLHDEVESRLLMEHGPDELWQVFHGPQQVEQLNALAKMTHWTLLVQSVNLWHSKSAALLKHFDFIPQWRLDDIMISYATDSGTVGPHVDQYDVFLIQLTGSRRWILGKPNAEVEKVHQDSGIQQVKPYPNLMNVILNAGDMIYIPPNTAHHGISIEPGMTLSVGFRSPALSELMMVFAEQINLSGKESYFEDPSLTVQQSSTEISSTSMTKAVNWFTQQDACQDQLRQSFGLLQTQPKQELLLTPVELSIDEIITCNVQLHRDPAGRVAWYQASEDNIWLFINGEFYQRPVTDKTLIDHLSTVLSLSTEDYERYQSNDNFLILMEIFVDSGLYGLK